MENKTKKCFCCGNELKDSEQICPKCGAVIPVEIDPVAYNRNMKVLKWSVIIGIIVGLFTAVLFEYISPDSYLCVFGILFGFGSVYLTSICFDKNNNKQKSPKKSKTNKIKISREEKWLAQEKYDKLILNRGDTLANQMLTAISSINALWECDTYLYEGRENDNAEFRSILYLLAITPELFLDNYFLFKAGNHDDIKDSICTERPYLVLETLIKMGLFIFKTNNNIFILKEIINGDKKEYLNSKLFAQRILNEELKD